METLKYIPGTCNIGREEIIRRRNGAIFSAILTVIVVCILLLTHADKLWRLVIFLPLTALAVSIQQWYFKFCVNFGMRGIYNFKELGNTTTVEDRKMKREDRAKAGKMILAAVVFGLVFTLIFYLLPFK